jgi:hypothetical protein
LTAHPIAASYFVLCCLFLAMVSFLWLVRKWRGQPACVLGNHSRVIRADQQFRRYPCGDSTTHLLARIPGNQLLQLEVNEKRSDYRRCLRSWTVCGWRISPICISPAS